MLIWMGRTALELIGQAGLGYSFDPLVSDSPDEFMVAIKSFGYVLSLVIRYPGYSGYASWFIIFTTVPPS